MHDVKRRLTTKKRSTNATGHEKEYRSTFADEIVAVMRLANTDKFIRYVSMLSDRVPCVILYNDRQIADITNFYFDAVHGSVLGCDKTFNLGSLFVTALTYINAALQRLTTVHSPEFWDQSFCTEHPISQLTTSFSA